MSADPFRQSPLGPTIHKATLEVYKAVFRIRMDPGFFAHPDPGIKSPDSNPSINKLMGSKRWF